MIHIGDFSTTENLSVNTDTGKIIINKLDDETSKPIEGVTFELRKIDGTVIGTTTTNSNGVATFSNLYQGDYIIKEIETNKNYVLNTSEFNVSVSYNQEVKTDITNEYKKGNLKIIKVDEDRNEIKLEGVKFNLLDSNENSIDTYVTDEKGEIYIENLRIGNYTVREISTQENYILNENDFNITIEYNNTTTITIDNEYKKGNLKVYKVDSDENKITLGGVKFDLIDKNGEVVNTLTTDLNGEIFIQDLRIGKYILREKQAKNHYELCEDLEIEIKWKDLTEVTIKNELTKGQVRIIKVDKDNNEIKLEGVSFAVLDEEMRLLEVIKTDENGDALTSRYSLRDNEKIYIQEISTPENYMLNNEIFEIKLDANKIKTITIENEIKKGKIKITKLSNGYSELLGIEDNAPLAGAKFSILNSNGDEVGIYETGEDGTIETDLLLYGEYTICENEAPEGYIKESEPQTVFIKENGELIEVIFKNSPVNPVKPEVPVEQELPKTGLENNLFSSIIDIIILGFISIFYIKTKNG